MITFEVLPMINDNSRAAYQKAYRTHKFDTLRWMVYETIADHPGVMDEDIAAILNRPINSITGRVKELTDAGLIEATSDKNRRGNTARRSWIKGSS